MPYFCGIFEKRTIAMTNIELTLGLVVVIVFTILLILFSLKSIRTRFPVTFRKIEAINRLKRAIGMAVEDGSRLHVSIGSSQLTDPANTSALIGLSTLHRIGQLTSTSDLPPISTSGSGGLLILSQDTLKKISVETNTQAFFDLTHACMTGVTPFSYAAGTMEAVDDRGVNGNVFIGNFGTEAGLLCETLDKARVSITGSDSITAQSIFFAVTPDTLIGEELYALPAYLASSAAHQASLRTQDIFRILVGIALVVGTALTVTGIL
jgi:hypothetical protein